MEQFEKILLVKKKKYVIKDYKIEIDHIDSLPSSHIKIRDKIKWEKNFPEKKIYGIQLNKQTNGITSKKEKIWLSPRGNLYISLLTKNISKKNILLYMIMALSIFESLKKILKKKKNYLKKKMF